MSYIPVPVDVAKKLRIIFDPSGMTEFVVERLGGATVAAFNLHNREQRYGGFIVCSNDTPMIVLTDPRDSIPALLKEAIDFPVVFASDAGILRGTATYVAAINGQQVPALIFRLPGLAPLVLQGRGLSLQAFHNPRLPPLKEKPDSTAVIDDAMIKRFAWIDAEQAFVFSILGANAEKTLPIVLDQCGTRQTH